MTISVFDILILFLMFQYAAVKPLPLNYTSMAESFYSRTLDSLSLWVRGLDPEVKANIFYSLFTLGQKLKKRSNSLNTRI